MLINGVYSENTLNSFQKYDFVYTVYKKNKCKTCKQVSQRFRHQHKGNQIADVVEIWRICCGCPVPNGVEKDIQQKSMLNWAVVRKRIDAVDSMINRAHSGLWDSKLSTDYSTGASTRLCIANAMTGRNYSLWMPTNSVWQTMSILIIHLIVYLFWFSFYN